MNVGGAKIAKFFDGANLNIPEVPESKDNFNPQRQPDSTQIRRALPAEPTTTVTATTRKRVDGGVVATALQALYAELTTVLTGHRGTLSSYAGDALYAVWELKHIPDANEQAVDFALAVHERVLEVAPRLPLRGPA